MYRILSGAAKVREQSATKIPNVPIAPPQAARGFVDIAVQTLAPNFSEARLVGLVSCRFVESCEKVRWAR